MDSKFRNNNNNNNRNRNPYMNEKEDIDEAARQENINIAESPPSSTVFNIDGLVSSSPTCSSKRSRRAIQKRVVHIPIKETEGPRLKGESNTPPSDSWAWRKYGQKPIKGSPYPRGYYRCSSSKGCPARKQVERSRVDPTMLVVTYSCEHNHPWPLSRNHHHNNNHSSSYARPVKNPEPEVVADPVEPEPEPEPAEEKFGDLGGDDSIIAGAPGVEEDELGWFREMTATTSSAAVLESPIFAGYDADVAASVLLPMGEEEESLFADLGELPECSVVFRRGLMETAIHGPVVRDHKLMT